MGKNLWESLSRGILLFWNGCVLHRWWPISRDNSIKRLPSTMQVLRRGLTQGHCWCQSHTGGTYPTAATWSCRAVVFSGKRTTTQRASTIDSSFISRISSPSWPSMTLSDDNRCSIGRVSTSPVRKTSPNVLSCWPNITATAHGSSSTSRNYR